MIATLAEAALRSFVLGSVVWFGLVVFRVRNPHVHMTAWVVVLVASLAMPFVMHWPALAVVRLPVPMPVTADLWPADLGMTEVAPLALPPASVVVAPPARAALPVNWGLVAAIVYAAVAALLLVRLALGLCLTWRLARAARPIHEPAVSSADVRVSSDVGGPVTFASTILVPPQFTGWDARKRLAVLAHESAHVANCDFYVLLLASINRAVFWFSPFAWWQLARLAEIAEIISDARAIEMIEDRLSYAEILLDVATGARTRPLELAMARASTVRGRIERIIAVAAMPASVGWRKRLWVAAAIVPAVIVSAGMIAYWTPDSNLGIEEAGDAAAVQHYRAFVNFYALGPANVFAIFRDGEDGFGQLTGQRKQRLTIAGDGKASYASSSGEITFRIDDERRSSELMLRVNGRDVRAVRVAEMPPQAAASVALDDYVGFYKLGPNRVLTVRHEGNRLQVQETGQAKFALLAEGADSFSVKGDDLLVFLRDDGAKVTRVLLQSPTAGPRLAPGIDAATAKLIESDFARRIAEVPDRFREQIAAPGGKEGILRGIEDIRHGTPNYDRMSAALAAKIHRQIGELQATLIALGAVESLFFRGVGPGGYDIYGAKFENGTAEFRLSLEPDGKVDDVLFRPDGNGEPGDVLSCGQEVSLPGQAGTSPIRMLLYNDTADDIQVFNLDADGHRKAPSIIRSNMSQGFLTTVNSPWIVADRSGQCLEVVLPGQRTRFHNVEASGSEGRSKLNVRRAVPSADGEGMLRKYIEALVRGEPDYDRMTAEVAAQTRAQLPVEQAILARLGALRGMSFRGVTALDSDIYIAQFANGSAEWRIGTKNGTITKIALGPSY